VHLHRQVCYYPSVNSFVEDGETKRMAYYRRESRPYWMIVIFEKKTGGCQTFRYRRWQESSLLIWARVKWGPDSHAALVAGEDEGFTAGADYECGTIPPSRGCR